MIRPAISAMIPAEREPTLQRIIWNSFTAAKYHAPDYRQRNGRFRSGNTRGWFRSGRRYVGIDPYNKLIGRNGDDNVEQVDDVTVQFRR